MPNKGVNQSRAKGVSGIRLEFNGVKNSRPETLSSRLSAWACIIAFFFLALPGTGYSQIQKTTSNQNEEADPSVICVLRLAVDLIIVEVEVWDQYGHSLSNLKHKDFIVYDNAKKQKVEYCSEEMESDIDGSSIKYKIGYYPPEGSQSGEFRVIQVRVRNGKKLRIMVQNDPLGYITPPKR